MAHGHSEEAHSHSRRARGFAAMDPEEQREIARKGGRASHQEGNGHEFDEQEAREAGRRGGRASHGGNGGGSEEEEYEESGSGTRGGSSEQHARAGRQSHKNR